MCWCQLTYLPVPCMHEKSSGMPGRNGCLQTCQYHAASHGRVSKTLTSRLGPRLGNHRASVVPKCIAIQLGVVALRRGLLVVVWPFRPRLGSCCGHVVVLQARPSARLLMAQLHHRSHHLPLDRGNRFIPNRRVGRPTRPTHRPMASALHLGRDLVIELPSIPALTLNHSLFPAPSYLFQISQSSS